MSQNRINNNHSSADTLEMLHLRWIEDRSGPTPRPREAWLQEYPECAMELNRWYITWSVGECAQYGEAEEEAISEGVSPERVAALSVAMEEALSRVLPPHVEPAPKISSLLQAIKKTQVTVEGLATRLRIGTSMFARLDRCLINPLTIPKELVRQLAAGLGLAPADLWDYFSAPPRLAAGAAFKADAPPHVETQTTFDEAVRNSPDMLDADKEYWLKP